MGGCSDTRASLKDRPHPVQPQTKRVGGGARVGCLPCRDAVKGILVSTDKTQQGIVDPELPNADEDDLRHSCHELPTRATFKVPDTLPHPYGVPPPCRAALAASCWFWSRGPGQVASRGRTTAADVAIMCPGRSQARPPRACTLSSLTRDPCTPCTGNGPQHL